MSAEHIVAAVDVPTVFPAGPLEPDPFTAVKLCKDCAHFERSSMTDDSANYDKCRRAFSPSLVDGINRPRNNSTSGGYCEFERREGDGRCGRSARFFVRAATCADEPPDPPERHHTWQDVAADEAGVPRQGEI